MDINWYWLSTILDQLFLYFFESKYIKQLILNECFQALITFGDNKFLTSFKITYPKESDLKVERQGNHFSFLDLCIKVEDSVFVYKPFAKRDKFSLFIVKIPHLSSNIPSTIFSGYIFSELLWIARCPLRTYDFIPWASELLSRIIA